MLQTIGLDDCGGLGGGLQEGSLGGGGLDVGGGLTVGFTGTIGFSVSVEGTGGQTLFSNLTTDPESFFPSLPSSHIFLRLEIEPVLLRLSSESSSSASILCLLTDFKLALALERSWLSDNDCPLDFSPLSILLGVLTFFNWDLKSTSLLL